MTSTHSFFQKCFVKICETSKGHNFLIFQTILVKFSLFCSFLFCYLPSEIKKKLNLFRTSPLNTRVHIYMIMLRHQTRGLFSYFGM